MPILTTDDASTSRQLYGPQAADLATSASPIDGTLRADSGTLTAWASEDGSDRYNDLVDVEGTPTTDVLVKLGVYRFWGPPGVTALWVSVDGGPRSLLTSTADTAAAAAAAAAAIDAAASVARDEPGGLAPLDENLLVPEARIPDRYVKVAEAPLNALREGIKGNGTTDDSAAWAALMTKARSAGNRAEVYIPPLPAYSKVTATVTQPDGVKVFTADRQHAEIRGTGTADTWAFAQGAGQKLDNVQLSAAGGGNTLSIPSSYDGSVRNSLLIQYVAGKHVLRHFGAGAFIDMTIDKVTFNAPPGATVAPIHLENSGNALNGSQWRDCRFNGNASIAAPFVRLLNTSPAVNGTYSNNHSFRDSTAEICGAGIIHATSVDGITIDHVVPWDVAGNYTDDLFKFAPQPGGGLVCRNIVVSHSGRRGGGLAAGKYDINFGTGSTECLAMFMAPAHAPLTAAKILMPTSNGLKIMCGGPGPMVESSYGGTFKLPDMSTTDRPSAASVGEGAMIRNSTTGRIEQVSGGVWRDALGNILA